MSNPKLPVRFLAFLACLVALAIAVSCKKLENLSGDDSPITISGGSPFYVESDAFPKPTGPEKEITAECRDNPHVVKSIAANGTTYYTVSDPAATTWEITFPDPPWVKVNSPTGQTMVVVTDSSGQPGFNPDPLWIIFHRKRRKHKKEVADLSGATLTVNTGTPISLCPKDHHCKITVEFHSDSSGGCRKD